MKLVGSFLRILVRDAKKLEHLMILGASDRYYERACLSDILFPDHPVSEQLVGIVESQAVKHLTLCVQDGASFAPTFARFLDQQFHLYNKDQGRTLTFTSSCTCPPKDPL